MIESYKVQQQQKKVLEEKVLAGTIELPEALQFLRTNATPESYAFAAVAYLSEGKVEEAIEKLSQGIQKHPVNYSLHYNLGYFKSLKSEWREAIKVLYKAYRYASSEKEENQVDELIKEIVKVAKAEGTTITRQELKKEAAFVTLNDCRAYPLQLTGESSIRKVFRGETKDAYLTNIYKSLDFSDLNTNTYRFLKTELVKGEEVTKSKRIETTTPIILPISKMREDINIKVTVNGELYNFERSDLRFNQYSYIRIEKSGVIEIETTAPIFVGHPIELKLDEKKPKLVLKIFIDGLSQQYL